MAETQTPIETLRRAQIYNCRSADPEHCKLPICADARAALKDVEVLVAEAEYARLVLGNAQNLPVYVDGTRVYPAQVHAKLTVALAKFQVKAEVGQPECPSCAVALGLDTAHAGDCEYEGVQS